MLGLLVLVGSIGGIIVGRAAWRARSIASIERFGSYVSYEHNQPNQVDLLPEFLRERLGDRWFSEVAKVEHRGEDYFEPPFTFGKLTEEDVAEICRVSGTFSGLREFLIETDLFSCRHLENWPQLTSLEELSINCARISDADLAIIGRMKGLKRLSLTRARFTAAGLQELAGLPLLEDLTLDKVQLTAGGATPVQGFAALTDLVINQSPEFDDEVISLFGSPPQLATINFNQTPIGDRGLAQLIRSGKVKSLIISDGKLTDACTKIIADYPAPGWLVLSGMPLTDASLKAFAGKPFPTLILSHTQVTDEAFRTLNEIPNVDYVSFSKSKVTGIGVNYLKPEIKLDSLDVSGLALTAEGIRALTKARTKRLALYGAQFGDQELMLFVSNSQLERLEAAGTQVTDEGLRAFYAARRRHFTNRGWEEKLAVVRDAFGNDDDVIPTSEIENTASEAVPATTTQ